MKQKIILVSFVLFYGLTVLLAAQEPVAIVEYFENTSGEMRVVTEDGEEYYADEFSFGEELPIGFTLITYDGDYAEIRLDPNGSIIRISENTNFRVDGLQGRAGADENTFSMAVGKLKAVMTTTEGSRYRIKGQSAVCGVRGTSMIYSVLPGASEIAYVLDGLIDFTNAAGETIQVGADMMADALAEVFQAAAPTEEMIKDLTSGMDFEKLLEETVPGYEVVEEAVVVPVEEVEEPEVEKPAVEKPAKEGFLAKLMELLGVEIGTVTIGGETYAKAIVQPKFALGKLKVALYLPLIYKTDMFGFDDPDNFYWPEDNDEWSFGTDQTDWQDIILDVLDDLFLKIRYIEWGKQRDPFFFKFGNLNNITVGHGTIMRNYANDTDFPAVRRIGLNLGIDSTKLGFEAMVNDAAGPEIFGARFYFRPAAPKFALALGVTAITDINPENIGADETSVYGKPIFLNGGLDLDLPIIRSDPFSLIMFGDFAAMFPYFREEAADYGIVQGFAPDAIFYDNQLKNWGLAAGFMGNILPVDYRLEYRLFDGTFRPAFYDNMYDRNRTDYVIDLVDYLQYPDDPEFNTRSMGIYGEAGYAMEKVFFIEAGYYWPWPVNPIEDVTPWPDDKLHVEVGIFKGLLPLYGSISLDRTGIASVVRNARLKGEELNILDKILDKNTVFSGELVWPFSPILDLAIAVTTNYDSEQDKVYPAVSILTRVNP